MKVTTTTRSSSSGSRIWHQDCNRVIMVTSHGLIISWRPNAISDNSNEINLFRGPAHAEMAHILHNPCEARIYDGGVQTDTFRAVSTTFEFEIRARSPEPNRKKRYDFGLGVPPDTDYPRISISESASNPDTDIIFSHPSIFVSVSVSES